MNYGIGFDNNKAVSAPKTAPIMTSLFILYLYVVTPFDVLDVQKRLGPPGLFAEGGTHQLIHLAII